MILDELKLQIEETTQVEASAVALISGIAGRIQAAIDNAIAGGATAEQLSGVQAEVTALKDSTDALAAAVTANTPPA